MSIDPRGLSSGEIEALIRSAVKGCITTLEAKNRILGLFFPTPLSVEVKSVGEFHVQVYCKLYPHAAPISFVCLLF
jgi:hypothetical protein